jgi:hypothetical protein
MEHSGITAVIESKTLKAKEKSMEIAALMLAHKVPMKAFLIAAKSLNEKGKATFLAALEYASGKQPDIVNDQLFLFSVAALQDEAPRVKWEAAKVIANSVHLFPKHLKKAVVKLLNNTEHEGTVVRWSAATALAKIIQINGHPHKELRSAVESILKWEKDRAIQKIYQKALKESGA